jgi:hypothetical protein
LQELKYRYCECFKPFLFNFISKIYIFFYFEHRPVAGTNGDAKEIVLSLTFNSEFICKRLSAFLMECNLMERVNIIDMSFREGILLREVMQSKFYKYEEKYCAIQGRNKRRAFICASLKKIEILFKLRK